MFRIKHGLACQVCQTNHLVFYQNLLSSDVLQKITRVVPACVRPQINHMGIHVHAIGFNEPDDITCHPQGHRRLKTISGLNLKMH